MSKHNASAELQGIGKNLRFTKTLTSAVTTAWGVDWDEVYIARDLMQNFFDANRDRLTEVHVIVDGKDVQITAPSAFNLDRLFYLGSEKGEEDIGHYGEGFKVAATCLLRNHSVNVIAASGKGVLRVRIAETPVLETGIYPVEYDFYENDEEIVGAHLLLRNCSAKLTKALAQSLSHFFNEGNPLLGVKLWESYRGAFSIYESTDGRGHVFYRKLKRGEMLDIPLVLVIDKAYGAIEKKISNDRDRKAFGEAIMRLFFNHFARYGVKGYEDGARVIVERAKHCWSKGHPLLNEVADAVGYHSWSTAVGREIFGDGYFARSKSEDACELLQFETLEKKWREEKKVCLPQYFGKFGALNARRHIEDLRAKALEEAKRGNQRLPSRTEAESIQLLSRIMRELIPHVAAVFDHGSTSYTVAQTETLLGELKNGRTYRSREVFLAADVFVMDFAEAFAVFLHEHAHIFGYDGHRGFTDALTELIDMVVRHRRAMDEYEEQWESFRKRVAKERQAKKVDVVDSVANWLADKNEEELRKLLHQVPAVVLRRLQRTGGSTEQS